MNMQLHQWGLIDNEILEEFKLTYLNFFVSMTAVMRPNKAESDLKLAFNSLVKNS